MKENRSGFAQTVEGILDNIHQLMQPVHGIWFLENVNPTELAKEKAYDFAFVFVPLPLKGATGSPGDPIAIK